MNMIDIKNIRFIYDMQDTEKPDEKSVVLDGVSLAVKEGEFIAVLGHNGSGKSTLAKHINALLKPVEGTVFVGGHDTSAEENVWKVRQTAGMVFQNPDNQIIASVVEEDIAFGPENLGIEPSEIRKRVDFALDAVNMTDYSKNSPQFLSGGQKQRVAIAGVLAMKPRCIVLDEPTAMLDPIGRRDVMNTVMKLNKEEQITIVFITHFMDEAVKADRVIVMDNGKVVLTGTPKEVFKNVDMLKSIELDVPQVAEIAHLLRNEGFNFSDSILTIEEMADDIERLIKEKSSNNA